MFQTELLHQKGTSETGEETDAPVRRTFEAGGPVDVKQQIEVRSQSEEGGCSDGG